MEICHTQCCALKEIHELNDYEGQPELALKRVCDAMVEDELDNGEDISALPVPGHVLFTAVVGYAKGDEDYPKKPTYGPEFESYLKKHRLGTVVRSAIQANLINHPTHKVRCYIWTPHRARLRAWWKENGGVIPERNRNYYNNGW